MSRRVPQTGLTSPHFQRRSRGAGPRCNTLVYGRYESERGKNIPVHKSFPVPDYFVHGWPLAGVRTPTFLNELPHLGSKTKLFGGQRFDRPLSVEDLHDDQTIRHIGERNLPSEDFHSEHCECENICGFGCRCGFCARFAGRVDDLRGEPSWGPCNSRFCHNCEDRVRGDWTETIITNLGYPCARYHHIGLNGIPHEHSVHLERRTTHSL